MAVSRVVELCTDQLIPLLLLLAEVVEGKGFIGIVSCGAVFCSLLTLRFLAAAEGGGVMVDGIDILESVEVRSLA